MLLVVFRRTPMLAGLVAASRHLQHPGLQTQRIVSMQRPHQYVPGSVHGGFFTILRSIRASARSRVSRGSSASTSVTSPRLSSGVASWPRRARPTQFFGGFSDMLRRLSAYAIGLCCARTSCTACSRNSVVYGCRGTRSVSPRALVDEALFTNLIHEKIHLRACRSNLPVPVSDRSFLAGAS